MVNRIKIGLLGPRGCAVSSDPEAGVGEMIDFWREKLDLVLPDQPDLILVPEVCDRPTNYSRTQALDFYRVRGERMYDFFCEVASENDCYMAYSAAREHADGTFRNSTWIIDREGETAGIYNKNHPTIGEIEEGILCGSEAPVIECDFGRVVCAICFDLNFDELRKKYAAQDPDLVIFCSMYHGGLMQNYWAYSLRAHFAAAVSGLPSGIINPVGETVAQTTNYFDHVTAEVNLDSAVVHLDYHWEALREMKAKYGEKVSIQDPGYLASVLISSESEDCTVDDLLCEFDIEPLDDYLNRALGYHQDPDNVGLD